jgi:tyrosyl-tRNA synthetase
VPELSSATSPTPEGPLSPEEQLAELERGVVDLVSREDLLARLKESVAKQRPLRIKAGFDPTRPDLHLGHAVLMAKMRQFQQLGHEVVFVVGDFTASIGDPSGKSKTRPALSREEIDAGAKSYAEQAFKILDRDKTRIEHNDSWLGGMKFADVVRLAGKYTLARMMERQDFKARWERGDAISIHELLYPLAQAQDSVHLVADVELGGTDQLFNLMVGRDLMKENGQRAQVVMTTPILEGLTAHADETGKIVGDKMSKSLDNYVGLTEPPLEQVGKLMSISDPVLWRYVELLGPIVGADTGAALASMKGSPREAKLTFAEAIASAFHGPAEAKRARQGWEKQFTRKERPDEIPEVRIEGGEPVTIVKALVGSGLVTSNGEARRKLDEGAVKIDGETTIKDAKHVLATGKHVLKLGRKWAAVVVP